jgi:hypothetical protein
MRPRPARGFLAAVVVLSAWFASAAAAQAKTPGPDNKWRIVCIHHALSDGVIVFRLTPVGGEALELTVPIKDGTYENDVAREVRKVFRANLPKEFHVETDDGEAVLVKTKRGKPDFVIEFVSHSVNGLGIRVELD